MKCLLTAFLIFISLTLSAQDRDKKWRENYALLKELVHKESYQEAIIQGLKTEKIAARLYQKKNIIYHIRTLKVLSTAYEGVSDYNNAVYYANKSGDLFKEVNAAEYHGDLIEHMSHMAILCTSIHSFENAEKMYQMEFMLLDTYHLRGTEDYALALNNRATLYGGLSRYGEADSLYEAARQIRGNLAEQDTTTGSTCFTIIRPR